MTQITVIKRNGRKEQLSLEKWQTQIAKVCAGIADVSQSMVEIKARCTFMMASLPKKLMVSHYEPLWT
jgi:hypothetical protein